MLSNQKQWEKATFSAVWPDVKNFYLPVYILTLAVLILLTGDVVLPFALCSFAFITWVVLTGLFYKFTETIVCPCGQTSIFRLSICTVCKKEIPCKFRRNPN